MSDHIEHAHRAPAQVEAFHTRLVVCAPNFEWVKFFFFFFFFACLPPSGPPPRIVIFSHLCRLGVVSPLIFDGSL